MKKTIVLWVAVFMLVFFTGCDGINKGALETEFESEWQKNLPRAQVASEGDSEYVWSFEEVKAYIEETLERTQQNRNDWDGLKITGFDTFTKTYKPGFMKKDGTPQTSEIWFYSFILENLENSEFGQEPGCAIICSDSRIGFIMMSAARGFNDPDPFMAMIRANLEVYIQDTISKFNRGEDLNYIPPEYR